MKEKKMKGSSVARAGFGLKDNEQAGQVKKIDTMAEDYDMGRMQYHSCGTKGYPSQAIQGK